MDENDREYVLDLIKYHDAFINFTKDKTSNPNLVEINEENVKKITDKIGRGNDFMLDLLDFCDADVKAQAEISMRKFIDGNEKCIGTRDEKLEKNQMIREVVLNMSKTQEEIIEK